MVRLVNSEWCCTHSMIYSGVKSKLKGEGKGKGKGVDSKQGKEKERQINGYVSDQLPMIHRMNCLFGCRYVYGIDNHQTGYSGCCLLLSFQFTCLVLSSSHVNAPSPSQSSPLLTHSHYTAICIINEIAKGVAREHTTCISLHRNWCNI